MFRLSKGSASDLMTTAEADGAMESVDIASAAGLDLDFVTVNSLVLVRVTKLVLLIGAT